MNASFQAPNGAFSEAQLRRVLASPAGKQLLRLLAANGGAALRQAAAAAAQGDHAQAYALLRPVLETDEAQALLRQLDG